ncbi:MAG TPA: reverse transcriptase family protein [Candidatus Andersenbacteria bacterium]|nr:reverse transcriptase family protein [Candidatus Andersenbacteria bacterium]
MAKAKLRKKRQRTEWSYADFRAVLELPERLSRYLRELLHLDKASWDFCLDRIRQYKAWQAKKKENPELRRLPKTQAAYFEWSKSKGKGKGRRYFAAPCNELKLVQKAILNRLLTPIPVHFCRHGNQPGSSILSNAERHRGFAKSVFSIDIINAFPTVFRSRIFANLKKPFSFVLRQFAGVKFSTDDEKQMLEALCDLICLHDRLPQGPPTSPRILDIVCAKMDQELYALLEKNSTPFQSYRITAWADDITISSDGEIPEELRKELLKVITENGFIPHTREDKTKYFSPETGEVPVVTGIVLTTDGRLTMAPGKVNQIRATLYQALKLKEWDTTVHGQVAGTLGYIRQIYPERIPSALRELVSQAETRTQEERSRVLSETKENILKINSRPPSKKGTAKTKSPNNRNNSRPARKAGEDDVTEAVVHDAQPVIHDVFVP